MTAKRERKLPSYSLLEGHVRQKKKLVPPMANLPSTRFVSTIDSIFPEIFWIGLILEYFGTRQGIEVVSSCLQKLWQMNSKPNWYRFTEICMHPDDVQSALGGDLLRQLATGFGALREVYEWPGMEWCPRRGKEVSRERVINGVRKYADRFEQPYLTILSTLIYSMAISDRMKFAAGTLPNIEAIVNDWGTEDAEMAACSVRACSMAFFPTDETAISEQWCRTFWRTNYNIADCEF